MKVFLTLVLCLLPSALFAATYYCGPAGTGSGSGADFNNRMALPDGASMGRHTYKIIEGSYGSRSFAAPVSGTTRCIVQKVSSADSAVAGYSSTLHDGQAVFGSVNIVTPYQTIDGVTRTETTRMEAPTGYGVRINDIYSSGFPGAGFDATGSQFLYCDVGGAWDTSNTPNCSAPEWAAYFPMQVNVTFTRCVFHNAGVGDGAIFSVHGSQGLTFDHCDFYMGWGKACIAGPNTMPSYTTIKYCRFWNAARRDSACTPPDHGPGLTCEVGSYSTEDIPSHVGHLIYGSVFYSDASGGRNGCIMYGEPLRAGTCQNIKVFNNTMVGFPEVSAVGDIYLKGGSGNEARNNLFYNTGSMTISANAVSHNVDAGSNPFVDYNNRDFRLAVDIGGGTALGAPYNVDVAGNTRTTWDVGAYEFGGAPSPPTILNSGTYYWTNGIAGSVQIDAAGTTFGAANLPAGLQVGLNNGIINGTPTATVTNTVTLYATNSAGWDDATVTFAVLPQSAVLYLPQSALTFPMIRTNTTYDLTFVITNSGPSGTTLSGTVSNASTKFSIVTSPATFSLSGTTTKTISMRYSPTAVGTNLGTVAVSSSAGSNYVSLSGIAYPVFTGTNYWLTNALVLPPVVATGGYIQVTNTQVGPIDPLLPLAIAVWGYDQTAQTTGTFSLTAIATNLTGGSSITVDAVSSEHVENTVSGETTPHTQGNLTDGYIVAAVGIWSQTDADVTAATYDGAAMQLLAAHNLDLVQYGEYRVQIYGLPVASKTSGTYHLAITANGGLGHYNAGIISLNHVKQTDSYGTAVDEVGTGTSAVLTVPSTAGELVFLAAIRGNSIGSPNSGETERVDTQPEADAESLYPDVLWLGTEPGAASVDIGVNFAGSEAYAATAVAIRPTTNYGINSVLFSVNTMPNYATNLFTLDKATNWATVQLEGVEFVVGTSNIMVFQPRESDTWVRLLTYTPNSEAATDTTPPSISITSPTNGEVYATSTASMADLAGIGADNVAVSLVTVTNLTTGYKPVITGTTSWSASSIPLTSGSNSIVVWAYDSQANNAMDTLTVIYTPPPAVVPSTVNDLRVNNLILTNTP